MKFLTTFWNSSLFLLVPLWTAQPLLSACPLSSAPGSSNDKLTCVIFVDGLKTQRVNISVFVTLTTTDPYFQEGWIHFQASLYYISPEEKTWNLSREFCLQRGADLTVINNRAEQVSGTASGPGWVPQDLTDDGCVLYRPSRTLRGNSRGPCG